MSDPNDIFEVDTQEAVTWLGAVATLDEAHAAIRRRAPNASGEYIVVEQGSGRKLIVRRDAE
jgi:hypothetical protein